MHTSVLVWVSATLAHESVTGLDVLEVGSYDVNGSVRPLFEAYGPATYTGVDQAAGPGVDKVVSCYDLTYTFGPAAFDVVVSTEMLEHVTDWREACGELVEVVAETGLLMLTTRSVGFPYHAHPNDWWRYSVHGIAEMLREAGMVDFTVSPDPDPRSPGVFAVARKPKGWLGLGTFSGLGVTAMEQPAEVARA